MPRSNRIAYHRRLRGLTQEALARQLGVSRQYIGHVETGIREPSLLVLRQLLDTFGVEFRDLYPDAPAMTLLAPALCC